jgi:LysM repeat protein
MAQRTATPHSAVDARQRARNLTLPILLTGSLAASMHLTMPSEASASPHDSSPRWSSPIPAPLPQVAAIQVQAAPAEYTVASGDTISSIAATFGLATASLLALNGLGWSSLIFPGQVLKLSGATATPAPPAVTTPAASSSYTVGSGDTVSGIASDHGVSVTAIFAANGLGSGSIIYPGQSLVIPAAGPATTPPPASPPAAKPVASSAVDVITPLSSEMAENARIIVGAGRAIGVSDEAIVIALAAAAQESSLRNVQFGDKDSLGLFQQRPSQGWGTPEELLDPVRAAKAFFGGEANPNRGLTNGLLDIPGWKSMSLTEAAQAVQKSAHPDEYAKWETSARAWLSQLA